MRLLVAHFAVSIIVLTIFGLLAGFAIFAYRHVHPETISVSQLLRMSDELDGQVVSVEGIARETVGIFGMGIFLLGKDPHSVLVVTETGVPTFGKTIRVTGTYRKVVSLNAFSYSAIYVGQQQ